MRVLQTCHGSESLAEESWGPCGPDRGNTPPRAGGVGKALCREGDAHTSCLSVVDSDKHLPDSHHPDPEPGPEAPDTVAGQGQSAHIQGCGQVRPGLATAPCPMEPAPATSCL